MFYTRKDLIKVFIVGLLFFTLTGCQEAGGTNFQSILQNLSTSYPALWRLLTAAAYVIGFVFIMKALFYMKIYGEARTMTSSQSSIKTPLVYMLSGAMLIFSPTAFQMVNMTLFQSPNPLSYSEGNIGSFTQTSIIAVVGLVQIIGVTAFIRGWILLARTGEQGGQPGTMGKALTHIVGGALAVNVVQFKDVIWNTFGFN